MPRDMDEVGALPDFMTLTRDLCAFATGVVADDNDKLFARIEQELELTQFRYKSGDRFNGWLVPDNWHVRNAQLIKDGKVVFDGRAHTLAVARYSQSFSGDMDWAELKPHLVTNPDLPDAYMFHCAWQYRPWAADWALSIPYTIYRLIEGGKFRVEIDCERQSGEMIVAHHEKPGRDRTTIVFHSNTCHPHMANDGFAGTAVLIRLFQWLNTLDTRFTYRLVLGPEHVGTVFYLRDMPTEELDRIACGIFEEMPGTRGSIKVASTFLGNRPIDVACRNAARHHSRACTFVPWRMGAGNDETVWEAPGYEVPFVEITRSEELLHPYREYHSSLDIPDLMDVEQLDEMYRVLQHVVLTLERNAVMQRTFNGLIALSNPDYDLYVERYDPSKVQNLTDETEKWGQLQDSLLRYFDGTVSILDIAERHNLPFDRLHAYIRRFAEKGLVTLVPVGISRPAPLRV